MKKSKLNKTNPEIPEPEEEILDNEEFLTDEEFLEDKEPEPLAKDPKDMTPEELEIYYLTCTETPPDAVEYQGYRLRGKALERFKNVEAFHLAWGTKKTFCPNWREKYGEKDPEAKW